MPEQVQVAMDRVFGVQQRERVVETEKRPSAMPHASLSGSKLERVQLSDLYEAREGSAGSTSCTGDYSHEGERDIRHRDEEETWRR